MKKLFLILILFVFSVPAIAADLEWTINAASGSVTFTSPAVTDTQMDRFLDFLWGNYAPVDENGDVLTRTNANEAAAFRAWSAANWQAVKRDVVQYEQGVAADTARGAVTDIEETP